MSEPDDAQMGLVLLDLPLDALSEVLGRCDGKSLVTAGASCKALLELSRDPELDHRCAAACLGVDTADRPPL